MGKPALPPVPGTIVMLTQPIQIIPGLLRDQVPVGSIARVTSESDDRQSVWVRSDRYNYDWTCLKDMWYGFVKPVRKPKNAFQDIDTFLRGLATDRSTTLRELMQRVCDAWLEDGRDTLVECLARWAEEPYNFGDVGDLIKIAEGHVDDQWD